MAAQQVFYDIAVSRLDEQMSRADAIDGKANNTVTFGTGVVALFGAFLAVGKWPSGVALVFFALALISGLVAFARLVWCALQSYRARDYSFRPNLADLETYSADHSEDETRQSVAEQCMISIERNEPILIGKAKSFDQALYAFPMEALCLFAAAVIALASK